MMPFQIDMDGLTREKRESVYALWAGNTTNKCNRKPRLKFDVMVYKAGLSAIRELMMVKYGAEK